MFSRLIAHSCCVIVFEAMKQATNATLTKWVIWGDKLKTFNGYKWTNIWVNVLTLCSSGLELGWRSKLLQEIKKCCLNWKCQCILKKEKFDNSIVRATPWLHIWYRTTTYLNLTWTKNNIPVYWTCTGVWGDVI